MIHQHQQQQQQQEVEVVAVAEASLQTIGTRRLLSFAARLGSIGIGAGVWRLHLSAWQKFTASKQSCGSRYLVDHPSRRSLWRRLPQVGQSARQRRRLRTQEGHLQSSMLASPPVNVPVLHRPSPNLLLCTHKNLQTRQRERLPRNQHHVTTMRELQGLQRRVF